VSRALVIAHRGASAREPENSLAAFRAAATLGADAVELDIHATADGALIVHHDELIERAHAIPRLTADQVRTFRLPNGEPLPTLEQALAAVGTRLQVFIEVKSLDPRFDAMQRGPNPSSYAIHSFDHRIVRRLGLVRPGLRCGVLSSSYPIRPLAALADAGATILWQERTMVDRPLADALHGSGMQLLVWTVDDAADMQRLLELGVDGLCSNRPDVARRAVDARGA